MKQNVIVNTARYESAHGKMPKGSGAWFFETRDRQFFGSYAGTYAEAKKCAIAQAVVQGVTEIYVGS